VTAVGVAEVLVLVLGVPGLYLLLFILTKIEQWLESGTQPADAPGQAAPETAVITPPAAAAEPAAPGVTGEAA
jgi:hypothetical protein